MNLIMKPFNGVFFGCFAVTLLIIVAIWFFFKDKSEKTKEVFLVSCCGFLIVFFFVYKLFLSVDNEFLRVSVPPIDKFNWFSELPLQLCNINMFLIPIGIKKKNRGIMGFSFFLAPLGGLMALIFPDRAFYNFSLTLPRMIGFYGTHFLLIVVGISLATLGFFRPKFKDFKGTVLTFIILALLIHVVNLVLVKTGVCTHANYFFTMNAADISILELFYKLIPLPFLYLIPAIAILLVYMSIVTFGFFIGDRLCKKEKAEGKREKELVNL